MAVNAPRPRPRSVSDIRSKLLRPATTSHFDIFIGQPSGPGSNWNQFKTDNGLAGFDQDLLHLCCSETVLPGSSLATTEINNDYTGVTERHAYRRLFDDRIDLTFYVMYDTSKPVPKSNFGTNLSNLGNAFDNSGGVNAYLPIRFFEGWIKYIAAESQAAPENGAGTPDSHYSYRMRYPKEYYGGLKVIKYERDYSNNTLEYNFVNAYPISVSSIPVSYDASSLLKVTISFSYIRYYIGTVRGYKNPFSEPLSAEQQALINQSWTNPTNFNLDIDYSQFTPINGIYDPKSSGNAIDSFSQGLDLSSVFR